MKFSEVLTRVNGFSTPIFGVSWQPPHARHRGSRAVVAFVEVRRVLFSEYTFEVPQECVASVLEIRERLTEAIASGGIPTELADRFRLMRRYCVRFLEQVGATEDRGDPEAARRHLFVDRRWKMNDYFFGQALGELRAGIGLRVALLAAAYGLDVEDELAQTLPRPEGP